MQKILISVISCFILISCGTKEKEIKNEKPAVPVLGMNPEIRDIPTYIESIGTFYPSVTMEIRSQINGLIDEIFVTEGQWVEKEALLMKIDSRVYEVKLAEAEAQIRMNRLEWEAAQRKVERFRKLAQQDLIAQAEWDEIITSADKAQALLNLSEVRLETIKLDLENCTLKSPIQGRVGKLDIHAGTLITGSSAPLVTIYQMDPLVIEFTVTEQELAQIPQNHPVVEIQAICGSSFGKTCALGSITFLDNYFDPKTGQLLVRGKVDNPAFHFRPGQTIKIKIPITTFSNALLIPQKAVRYNAEGSYVYVVNEEKQANIRQIILGEALEKDVIVLEGILPSDIIITDGHLRTNPGSKVDIQL